jgi:hypothetical protein
MTARSSAVFVVAVACACVACDARKAEPAALSSASVRAAPAKPDATSGCRSLPRGAEYQVRLKTDSLRARGASLASWLTGERSTFVACETAWSVKKRRRRVVRFDTDDGLLASRDWHLRARVDTKEGSDDLKWDLALKANAKNPDDATRLCFEAARKKAKNKLERDHYAQSRLSKWAYTVTYKSSQNDDLPRPGRIGGATMLEWFPRAAAAVGVTASSAMRTVRDEYWWRAELEVALGDCRCGDRCASEMNVDLKYPSEVDYDGDRNLVAAELAFKGDVDDAAAIAALKEVAAGWGQPNLD